MGVEDVVGCNSNNNNITSKCNSNGCNSDTKKRKSSEAINLYNSLMMILRASTGGGSTANTTGLAVSEGMTEEEKISVMFKQQASQWESTQDQMMSCVLLNVVVAIQWLICDAG